MRMGPRKALVATLGVASQPVCRRYNQNAER
jgi:hypothetical protein